VTKIEIVRSIVWSEEIAAGKLKKVLLVLGAGSGGRGWPEMVVPSREMEARIALRFGWD